MKEIAIFGGSFNPPTRAHEAVIRACLDEPFIDQVWVMPSGDRIDKQYAATDKDRLNMLEIMCQEAFDDDPRVQICRLEMDMPRPTQTYKTVQEIHKRHPGRLFRFVYGCDAYRGMPKWQNGDKLQRELPILIAKRNHEHLPHADNLIQLDHAPNGLSSATDVRQAIAAGNPVNHMVCSGVELYIKQHDLYRD